MYAMKKKHILLPYELKTLNLYLLMYTEDTVIFSENVYVLQDIISVVKLLVEQELLTLPEHLSSPPVFSGVRVTQSLVLYLCFVDRCLSFCTFSVGHCVVCSD